MEGDGTMPTPGRPDVNALLAHAGWIASLASSLVADPNQAEDLVQKTWVAALEHPPRAPRCSGAAPASTVRHSAATTTVTTNARVAIVNRCVIKPSSRAARERTARR